MATAIRAPLLRRSERAAAYLPHDPVAVDLAALRELALAVEAITPECFSKYQKLLETLDHLKWKPSRAKATAWSSSPNATKP